MRTCVPRMPRSACNNAKNLQSQSNEQWLGAGGRGRSPEDMKNLRKWNCGPLENRIYGTLEHFVGKFLKV